MICKLFDITREVLWYKWAAWYQRPWVSKRFLMPWRNLGFCWKDCIFISSKWPFWPTHRLMVYSNSHRPNDETLFSVFVSSVKTRQANGNAQFVGCAYHQRPPLIGTDDATRRPPTSARSALKCFLRHMISGSTLRLITWVFDIHVSSLSMAALSKLTIYYHFIWKSTGDKWSLFVTGVGEGLTAAHILWGTVTPTPVTKKRVVSVGRGLLSPLIGKSMRQFVASLHASSVTFAKKDSALSGISKNIVVVTAATVSFFVMSVGKHIATKALYITIKKSIHDWFALLCGINL